LSAAAVEAAAFRRIFETAHAGHATCLADEWLSAPCPGPNPLHAGRSIVWSRRNGPWQMVDLLFVGAAPGNAGGRGTGELGAHATRIPFGGDVAGANLDTLLAEIGTDRNNVFLVAALNCLPTLAELRAPVGAYGNSLLLLRDTLIATAPSLIVCLGNVAVRAVAASVAPRPDLRLPTLRQLGRAGLERGRAAPLECVADLDTAFLHAFAARERLKPHVLWILHPSAQNMSPFAAADTRFHRRMIETRDALRRAVHERFGAPLRASPGAPQPSTGGIYALADWRERVAPRHDRLIRLWRERGL